MLKEVSSHSQEDSEIPVVIVDRINTLRVHRQDVFGALRSIGTRVAIVWENELNDCLFRIKSRGFGHRTIGPSDNAKMILNRTLKEYEPLSQEEIQSFGITKVISIKNGMTREEVLSTILDDLKSLTTLAFLHLNEISSDDISRAVRVAAKREEDMMVVNESKIIKATPRSLVREGRYELVVNGNTAYLNKLFASFNTDPKFTIKQHFHVTLLFISSKLAKQLNGTKGSDPYMAAIQEYKQLMRSSFVIKPLYIAKNDRVMAVKVQFLNQHADLPHFDVVPHISVAKADGVEFREANFLIEECDKLRTGNSNPTGTIQWLDLPENQTLSGSIQFKLHGQA